MLNIKYVDKQLAIDLNCACCTAFLFSLSLSVIRIYICFTLATGGAKVGRAGCFIMNDTCTYIPFTLYSAPRWSERTAASFVSAVSRGNENTLVIGVRPLLASGSGSPKKSIRETREPTKGARVERYWCVSAVPVVRWNGSTGVSRIRGLPM